MTAAISSPPESLPELAQQVLDVALVAGALAAERVGVEGHERARSLRRLPSLRQEDGGRAIGVERERLLERSDAQPSGSPAT